MRGVEEFSAVLDDAGMPWAGEWLTKESMKTARSCNYGVVAFDGCIYSFGGFDGTNALSSVEEYDPASDDWMSVTSMHTRRQACGAAALGDFIYVAGGFNGHQQLQSAEKFDPINNHWQALANMSAARYGCGVVAQQDTIVVVGGYNDHDKSLATTEVYDPGYDEWREMPPMREGRYGFCCEVLS